MKSDKRITISVYIWFPKHAPKVEHPQCIRTTPVKKKTSTLCTETLKFSVMALKSAANTMITNTSPTEKSPFGFFGLA